MPEPAQYLGSSTLRPYRPVLIGTEQVGTHIQNSNGPIREKDMKTVKKRRGWTGRRLKYKWTNQN